MQRSHRAVNHPFYFRYTTSSGQRDTLPVVAHAPQVGVRT